ncbi:hypothetical protein OG562_01835 [Streptomyces sp. NBC_01275]|uniref:hypothetical protein n=1 Tax=Streptomyces sp. NBC_01275 TaxID=2903807 RepID=UPI00225015AB|nr:hypothetical protein [Streptomyces sp. NBC_01275]MCX4759747.1 hypothetical protein [Streptomyces sp. NBC_01275]
MALKRAQHWDLGITPPTPLPEPTGHRDCVTDMESYLMPMEQARAAALYSWGVMDGLWVSARPGESGLTVSPGAALDVKGRLITLAVGSFAVVDQDVDPAQLLNVPTVPVGSDGVTVDASGLTGLHLLTLNWREAVGADDQTVLLHTPWLRLVPAAGFVDTGEQVVLCQVGSEASGVTLAPATRRLVRAHAERLELRAPVAASNYDTDDLRAAEISATVDGGLGIDVAGFRGARRPALTVQGLTGYVGFGTADPAAVVHIHRDVRRGDPALLLTSDGSDWGAGLRLENGQSARTYGMYTGSDGNWHFADSTAGQDRIVVDPQGRVGIGATSMVRTLQVEGSEVHSGGGGGGFSFADRQVGSLVEYPGAGQRWVWYATEGKARLWSGFDRLTVGIGGEGDALDVPARMRVRRGWDNSAGIWFHQGPGSRAFVGMLDDNRVGLFGAGYGWSVWTDVNDGGINVSARHVGVVSRVPGTGIIAGGGTFAGYFEGAVGVTGDLSVNGRVFKGGGGFRIDHPLAPTDRYLSHSFVESPEMLNVYGGTVVTDDTGEATVVLPDYFEVLNSDHRYQLTPIGEPTLVSVAQEIRDNSFVVRSGRPGATVCWQVTGVRQDAWARAHRIPVEEDKPEEERELYLHPEAHEQAPERGLTRLIAARAARSDTQEEQ